MGNKGEQLHAPALTGDKPAIFAAVRAGADGPLELYNLKNDLGETNNVADKNPEIVARFTEYLKTARTEDKNWPIRPSEDTASAQK